MRTFDKQLSTATVMSLAIFVVPATQSDSMFLQVDRPALRQATQLPEGVTPEKITLGETVFSEVGCTVCHGPEGKGTPGMTGDLTDGEWSNVEGGTYLALVAVVKTGLSAEKAGGPLPMPAKGGKDLTDEQVEALAAYLWSVNRKD
jgi:mono/diheme cytochrome c family protein